MLIPVSIQSLMRIRDALQQRKCQALHDVCEDELWHNSWETRAKSS